MANVNIQLSNTASQIDQTVSQTYRRLTGSYVGPLTTSSISDSGFLIQNGLGQSGLLVANGYTQFYNNCLKLDSSNSDTYIYVYNGKSLYLTGSNFAGFQFNNEGSASFGGAICSSYKGIQIYSTGASLILKDTDVIQNNAIRFLNNSNSESFHICKQGNSSVDFYSADNLNLYSVNKTFPQISISGSRIGFNSLPSENYNLYFSGKSYFSDCSDFNGPICVKNVCSTNTGLSVDTISVFCKRTIFCNDVYLTGNTNLYIQNGTIGGLNTDIVSGSSGVFGILCVTGGVNNCANFDAIVNFKNQICASGISGNCLVITTTGINNNLFFNSRPVFNSFTATGTGVFCSISSTGVNAVNNISGCLNINNALTIKNTCSTNTGLNVDAISVFCKRTIFCNDIYLTGNTSLYLQSGTIGGLNTDLISGCSGVFNLASGCCAVFTRGCFSGIFSCDLNGATCITFSGNTICTSGTFAPNRIVQNIPNITNYIGYNANPLATNGVNYLVNSSNCICSNTANSLVSCCNILCSSYSNVLSSNSFNCVSGILNIFCGQTSRISSEFNCISANSRNCISSNINVLSGNIGCIVSNNNLFINTTNCTKINSSTCVEINSCTKMSGMCSPTGSFDCINVTQRISGGDINITGNILFNSFCIQNDTDDFLRTPLNHNQDPPYWATVYANGTGFRIPLFLRKRDDGPYSDGYYTDGIKDTNYTNTTPQQALDNKVWYTYDSGEPQIATGAYPSGFFF